MFKPSKGPKNLLDVYYRFTPRYSRVKGQNRYWIIARNTKVDQIIVACFIVIIVHSLYCRIPEADQKSAVVGTPDTKHFHFWKLLFIVIQDKKPNIFHLWISDV